MHDVLIPTHDFEAKSECKGACCGYGTRSNCPTVIVVSGMLAAAKERDSDPRTEAVE